MSYLGSELLLDDFSDSLSSPDIAPKPEVLGTFLQKRRKLLRPLLFGQLRRASWPWRRLERLLAPFAGFFHPVTYRAVADAERLSDIGLSPALSLELEGTEAPSFAPIRGIRIHNGERFYQQAPSRSQDTAFRELIHTSVHGDRLVLYGSQSKTTTASTVILRVEYAISKFPNCGTSFRA